MRKAIVAVSAVAVAAAALGASGCASCSRAAKSISSDMGGGIDRTVTLYDYQGDELCSWSGKFDISEEAAMRAPMRAPRSAATSHLAPEQRYSVQR